MIEAEWERCDDPEAMLESLRGRASDRKLRLFAVACCHRIEHLLADERSRRALELVGHHIEGQVSDAELGWAGSEAEGAFQSPRRQVGVEDAPVPLAASAVWSATAAEAELHAVGYTLIEAAIGTANQANSAVADVDRERAAQADLVRDIFGNPLLPVAADPAWLTSTVAALARGIYDEHAFDRLPILADALHDAGCENEGVLDHCRGPGPHVRGCWVVDLVLGKK